MEGLDTLMTITNDDEPTLAGDIDAQQISPEDDFDINEQHPEAAGMVIDPSDVVSLAKAVSAGVPIGALAEAHEASLTTHTWTPGVACPMRSVNRKVHSLTSIYNLDHPDNTIQAPPEVSDVAWLARCETHEADLYSKTFAPAWRARNRPWTFCDNCRTIFEQRYGKNALRKQALKKGKKLKTVAVAPSTPKAPKAPKVEVVADERFETTEDLKAAGIPGTITPAQVTTSLEGSDEEEAVWNEWSDKLSKQTPAGGVIDWLAEYHYAVRLADGRLIECRIHKGDAVFAHQDAKGAKHYTDTLPAMLAEIG